MQSPENFRRRPILCTTLYGTLMHKAKRTPRHFSLTMKNVSVSVLPCAIIKALRLARIEHCSGTVVTPFSFFLMEPLCKRATSVTHLTNFPFELLIFYELFTEDASLLFPHHGPKKSKLTKAQIKGGGGRSCLNHRKTSKSLT